MTGRASRLSRSLSPLLVSIVCACGGTSTEPTDAPLSLVLTPTEVSTCGGQDGPLI